MKTLAVLDLGTNTFHLHIARVGKGDFETVFKLQIPVKLGEGGINRGYIDEKAYARGMHALMEFTRELKKYSVQVVRAFATSAIRDAQNGQMFLEEARNKTGLEVGTITGDEEAVFIYKGVRHSLPFTTRPMLVMDIGGGSVEFVIANDKEIFWKQSFRLGAARLIEKYHQQDPMGAEEREAMYECLNTGLQPLWLALQKYPVSCLVGSAGSFESIVDLIEDLLKKDVQKFSVHSYLIQLADYFEVHDRLLHSTLAQREKMKGLVAFRVEMMVAASCLIDVVLKRSGVATLVASEYSMKEGILLSEGD